jgi:diaminohydroxyphosphoribosylaminopyrimidine deaminase/5-amino-6-(5-phosphoribosylamino)uracil reductase
MTDQDYILKTFDLAQKGHGTTWPNPLVGAVIVKNGKIIGEGFHLRQGLDHAEVDALKNCSESPEGATIYVNLEPCCHTNKTTPPCAQRLVTEKIKKVVICNLDPNPNVNGKGVVFLRKNGIEVEHGILSKLGEELNEVFFHTQRSGLPFVHLKLATTLDGKMALPSGESQWITGEKARGHVHWLRSKHQAILVGAQTARKDNPKLNVRIPHFQGPQPKRVVFTRSGILPQNLNLLTDELKENTLVYTMSETKIDLPSDQIIYFQYLEEALKDLKEKKMINLFLEGGSDLASEFMKHHFVNRVSLYMNPSFLGAGASALSDLGIEKLIDRPRLQNTKSEWLGEDLYLSGRMF